MSPARCWARPFLVAPAQANQTATNFIAKYGPTGALLWVRGDPTLGSRIAVDSAQCLYTAGTFSNVLPIGSITLSNNASSTIFLAKYDANGNPLWAQQLPAPGT